MKLRLRVGSTETIRWKEMPINIPAWCFITSLMIQVQRVPVPGLPRGPLLPHGPQQLHVRWPGEHREAGKIFCKYVLFWTGKLLKFLQNIDRGHQAGRGPGHGHREDHPGLHHRVRELRGQGAAALHLTQAGGKLPAEGRQVSPALQVRQE